MGDDWIRDEESARRIEERTALSTAAKYSRGPAARLLDYYEYHDNERLTCPHCGWTGLSKEGSREVHRELFDVSCRACDKMLLVVSFPTVEETRRAAAAGNAEAIRDRADVDLAQARQARGDSLKLKPDSDLPELDGASLQFIWDFEQADGDYWTLIRCSGILVWRELAYWEGWERFNEVRDILKSRYGGHFESMEPTNLSEKYLFGDDLGAPGKLNKT